MGFNSGFKGLNVWSEFRLQVVSIVPEEFNYLQWRVKFFYALKN